VNYTQNELRRRIATGLAALALAFGLAGAARADSPLTLSLDYKVDLTGVAAGGLQRGGRVLDNLTVAADLDLDRAVGWRGGALHLELLANSGGTPSALAGNLQGVDNIEVGRPRIKLFQAYVEQAFGERANLRLGFSDLNSEFYAADSAGLLLAPGFGIGSELAATGPAGPSIFPSTALAARLRFAPSKDSYVQAAVFNARAGVPGDPGGPDWSFDDGVLAIAEAGWTGEGRLAVGVWSYSQEADDIRETDPFGQPLRRRGQGAYAMLERDLAPGRTGFVKLGVSDGRTSDFSGGWQAGVLVEKPAASRPDSLLSFGVTQAWMSPGAVKNLRAAGGDPAHVETQFELTWSDKLSEHVTLQPDLQYILSPGGDRSADNALVVGVRLGIGF
jgi:porin